MSKQTDMGKCMCDCCDMKGAPVMEFMLPESEVDREISVGDIGTVAIPVVVVAINDGMVTFRKTDKVNVEGGFRKETLDEMRKRIIDEQEEAVETPEEESTEDESKE